jgi:hypothetical protein
MRRNHQEPAAFERQTVNVQVEQMPCGIGKHVEVDQKRSIRVPLEVVSASIAEPGHYAS